MRVVFEANVVFAGAGWRGEAYYCLVILAHRRVIAFATDDLLEELRCLAAERGFKTRIPQTPFFSGITAR